VSHFEAMDDESTIHSPQSDGGTAEEKMTDELTGIPNRLALRQFLAKREDEPLGVVIADIDRFMNVNDEHGHRVGDKVLAEVAGRLVVLAPSGSVIGRLGGDEFFYLINTDDITEVQDAALQMMRVCDAAIVIDDLLLDVHLSAGITIAPPRDPQSGLLAAENAMYEAKRRGGARALCLDPAWESD
jgi:diguanylate cyclase (GGDEF)-like protein